MIDLATDRQHLAKAERDIAEGEGRVARQADLVERLRRDGHDVARSEALLRTLRETLRAWEDRRQGTLRTIANMEAGVMSPDGRATAESPHAMLPDPASSSRPTPRDAG